MAQSAPSESRRGQAPAVRDCTGDVVVTNWKEADLNNQRCAAAGLRMVQNNPAVAAAIAANGAAGFTFGADPFGRRIAGQESAEAIRI